MIIFAILFVGVIVFAMIFIAKKQRKTSTTIKNNTKEVTELALKNNPNFNADYIIDLAKDFFTKYLTAWTNNDRNAMLPISTQNFINITSARLEHQENFRKWEYYENINVTNAFLTNYAYHENYEGVVVYLSADLDYWYKEKEEFEYQEQTAFKKRCTVHYKIMLMRPKNELPKCNSCKNNIKNITDTKCSFCNLDVHEWNIHELNSIDAYNISIE